MYGGGIKLVLHGNGVVLPEISCSCGNVQNYKAENRRDGRGCFDYEGNLVEKKQLYSIKNFKIHVQ